MVRAVIYARFSSSAQREESIDAQIRECTEYANKNNMTIIKTYADHAKSGKTANRPEFQKMIKDSGTGLFDAVILYTIDRFARNRLDSAMYKARLKKNNVTVHYAKQPIGTDPEGILLEALMEGYAEYYSASLARSVKSGMKENALKSHSTGGVFPLGYTNRQDGGFVIVPYEAEAVKLIFELYAQHTPKTQIAKILNEKGYHNKLGKPFNKNSFECVLRNPKYYGLYKYDDIEIENGMPAIITKELFEKVQHVLAENMKSKARYKAKEEYLLSSRLFCNHCQSPMVGESGTSKTGTVYRYYKCSKQKKHKNECIKKPVRKELIERVVVETLINNIFTDESIERIATACVKLLKKENAENCVLKALEDRLKEVNKGIGNLIKFAENGVLIEDIEQRITELNKERKELEKKIHFEKISHPVLSKESIIFWLSKYKKRDVLSDSYDRFIIETFVNRVYISDTDDGLEMTIILNLSENNTLRVSSSDFKAMVQHTRQYPNSPVLFDRFGMVAFFIIIKNPR